MAFVRPDRSLIALILGFLVAIAVISSTIWLYASQQRNIDWINHTLRVENQLSSLLSRVQAAESGQRGFMLTRDPDFLQSYDEAEGHIPSELDALAEAIRDNPKQQLAVARLRELTSQRMALLAKGITDRIAGRAYGPAHYRPGLAIMRELRETIAEMKAEEEGLLRQRTLEANRLRTWVGAALASSAIAIILFGLFALMNSRRRLTEAVAARDALAQTNENLVAEGKEREAAEAQLRQVQKMESIGQLTGGIAHDFNNMLAIVVGSLDMARRRLGEKVDERVASSLDNAMEGAQRATQLTARLLAFSRQQPLEPQPLDVNKLVGGMSEMLRRTIGESLRVETVLAGGLWTSFADPNQLESAILNLCVNARDAMPEGGRLTIETVNAHLDDAYAASHSEVQSGQYVMVSVTDTGFGMPREVAERAFDPFFTTKGVGKGTGLGLSQVFGFIKQSGGHVKIYSEPGEGTTIKLYLPRHYGSDGAAEPKGRMQHSAELPRAQSDEIILVVEDEDRVRHVSVDALRELGYTVVQASDASQALAVLAIQPHIDLLFTDIVMPDKNGRQLAEEAIAQRPGLKVLYTTGYTRNAIVHNGMLDAGLAFLSKPFTLTQLALKVRQVLDEGRG